MITTKETPVFEQRHLKVRDTAPPRGKTHLGWCAPLLSPPRAQSLSSPDAAPASQRM